MIEHIFRQSGCLVEYDPRGNNEKCILFLLFTLCHYLVLFLCHNLAYFIPISKEMIKKVISTLNGAYTFKLQMNKEETPHTKR